MPDSCPAGDGIGDQVRFIAVADGVHFRRFSFKALDHQRIGVQRQRQRYRVRADRLAFTINFEGYACFGDLFDRHSGQDRGLFFPGDPAHELELVVSGHAFADIRAAVQDGHLSAPFDQELRQRCRACVDHAAGGSR